MLLYYLTPSYKDFKISLFDSLSSEPIGGFNQTCLNKFLGGLKVLVSISRSYQKFEMSNFDQIRVSV